MSARRRLHFRKVVFRLGVVAFLALLAQVAAVRAPFGDDDLPRRILFVLSYLLLLAFVAANLSRIGIAVIGAGLLLNFAAIIANGGLMPITPETALKSGALPSDAQLGHWLPGSKDVLLERGDAHLWFLGDRFTWDAMSSVVRAFSLGDVVLMLGLVVTILDLVAPRLAREGDGGLPGGAASRERGHLP